MQENHRNGQDDSDIVETRETFIFMRAALNRHSFVSRPANQLGGHLSANHSGPDCSEKIFEDFQVS